MIKKLVNDCFLISYRREYAVCIIIECKIRNDKVVRWQENSHKVSLTIPKTCLERFK